MELCYNQQVGDFMIRYSEIQDARIKSDMIVIQMKPCLHFIGMKWIQHNTLPYWFFVQTKSPFMLWIRLPCAERDLLRRIISLAKLSPRQEFNIWWSRICRWHNAGLAMKPCSCGNMQQFTRGGVLGQGSDAGVWNISPHLASCHIKNRPKVYPVA